VNDVSRETPSAPPATPELARRVFSSERLPVIEAYAASLATDGVTRGLIGPREAPRLWERHLLNCAVLGDVIDERATVCDVGSGAGLPGIVLAIARPDLTMTLVEPLLRRSTYLSEVSEQLGLTNVEVVRARADEVHGTRSFDVVTSRAVAPLDRLLGWSMPLVAPEGRLVAMKGSGIADEIVAASSTLARLGCAEPVVLELGAGVISPQTFAVQVAWADPRRVVLADGLTGRGSAVPQDVSGTGSPGTARPGKARSRSRKTRRP
jgi:16S rRNA (guanine527-N7)-methyltransferase